MGTRRFVLDSRSVESIGNGATDARGITGPGCAHRALSRRVGRTILSAATFPDEVAIANYWLGQNTSLTGSALMQAVDTQSWDPSVKALTQFPTVLGNMAKNLTWTSSLGEAFHDQQADVMTAVQTLRAKAKAAGNLKTTPQVTVVHSPHR